MSRQVATSFLIGGQTIAAAGSAQSDGTQIATKSPCIVVVTGADATKGVVLPYAVKGKIVIIKNIDVANAVLKVYPRGATAVINALTATSALSMAAKTSAMFVASSTTQWYTVPLLPS